MRRHLRKCCPQPLTQLTPEANDELANDTRPAKKSKFVLEDLSLKTDRELKEFIWMNKRNIGLLEQKLPDKAIAIKQAIKCYEDEINRRCPKEKSTNPYASLVAVKIEVDDQIITENENSNTGTHADVNEQRTSPQSDNGEVVIEAVVGDQTVTGNGIFNGNITEEDHAGSFQIVSIHGDENQASTQQPDVSILPEDACMELRKVSSVLSLLTSPNSFYIPHNNPLDEKTKQAKQSLTKLLKQDLKTLIGSPDEQTVKHCVQILIKNLDKLPKFQGRVIQTLHAEFESACKNWTTWGKTIQENTAIEVKESGNLEVLQEWQEKDEEIEGRIVKLDVDIERLKAELREKELAREGLVREKFDLFSESRISIGEAKKILEEMVSVKLRSDVAIDNMNDLSTKWERIRDNFLFK
ncbi:hypothetical protein LXL04_019988 [Taraxacum kok-saghyz]